MLISEDYREQQKYLHENYEYGTASVSMAPLVTEVINRYEADELLDYGSGRGNLAQSIKPNRPLTIYEYEPAHDDEAPDPSDLVCCIDVLEHVEPELLDNVLDDLKRVTKRVGFFSVHIFPAVKVLPDGRNAHLIQENYKWWLPKIETRFKIKQFSHKPDGFYVLCEAL